MEKSAEQKEEKINLLISNIPQELKAISQWVLWKFEYIPGQEKPKKPPFRADGKSASVNEPKGWSTFEGAIEAYRNGDFQGIGFILTAGLTVIDLDDCIEDETPNYTAQHILAISKSYAEKSPSKKGYHIFLYGSIPGSSRRRGKVEMYDRGRYITFTGEHLEGTPREIRTSIEAIVTIHQQYIISPTEAIRTPTRENRTPITTTDANVIEKALKAKNGAKFQGLWRGNTSNYPSPSEAHLALAGMLIYWTNGDTKQVDRLFRQSGMFDEQTSIKWDEVHFSNGKTYGQQTIDLALDTNKAYKRASK